jgi:tyrosyl-tRNA synthetase
LRQRIDAPTDRVADEAEAAVDGTPIGLHPAKRTPDGAHRSTPAVPKRRTMPFAPVLPSLVVSAAGAAVDRQMQLLTAGAVDVITEHELRTKLESGRPLRVKLGIDPTASDIHLGFAVVLRRLRLFQDLGHVAVLILGDFTAQVGDPSGRSATRPRLSTEEVDAHAQTYLEQVGEILDMSEARLEVRRNSEWLGLLGMEDILRMTSQVTVARMLERDDFAKRYRDGVPISLMEFLYPLLQGTDSVAVRADVELGGTDQLFNLLVGRHLQQQNDQAPQVVLTTPLLVGLDGTKKMSKSLKNYVGIAEPPDEQFGKVMSIPDDVTPMYFRYATDWPPEQVDEILGAIASGALHPHGAKRLLARTVVDLYHGAGAGGGAQAEFDRVFKEKQAPTDMPEVELRAGILLSEALLETGLVGSKREARREIEEQGSVRVDDVRWPADGSLPGPEHVLQVGRRRWARVRLVEAPTV